MAEVTYDRPIALDDVVKGWEQSGWKVANPDYRGPSVLTVIEGSFEGSQWVTAEAAQRDGKTVLSVWVNRSEGDQSAHGRQAKEAAELLEQFSRQVAVSQRLKPGKISTRVNWGCEFH